MEAQSGCWFCHRSDAEVSAFADVETPKEKEIQQQMSQVTGAKADFAQSADLWRKMVPKEYKEFDFEFVTTNADQFKPIRIGNGLLGEIAAPNKLLGEIVDAKRLTVDWLESVVMVLRKEDGDVPGFGPLSAFEKADKDQLSKMVEQFEAKWRRRIGTGGGKGSHSGGYTQGFEGLKLIDGLEFMIAVGLLYYDVQAQLLGMAKRKEISSKPRRGISALLVSGYPPVPVCDVCAEVMRDLGSRRLQVETAVAQQIPASIRRA